MRSDLDSQLDRIFRPGKLRRSRDVSPSEPILSNIEKSRGLILKLAYLFTHRKSGKMLTPLKVHSARLPPVFGLSYGRIGKLDRKLTLPPETLMLIREQVARINTCTFCTDIGRWLTIKRIVSNSTSGGSVVQVPRP